MKVSSPILATAEMMPCPGDERAARHPAWHGFLRLVPANHVLALADQAVVSGASFLTLIMVARATDATQLGAFAIATSAFGVALALQQSLVSQPYAIQRHGPPELAGERAFCSLIQTALLAAVGICVLALAALALSVHDATSETAKTAWVLAALLPLVMAKEMVRDFAFAHLRLARALTLDVTAASIQFALLGWLAFTGRMSVLAALASVGISCGAVAIAWLYLTRADFALRTGSFRMLFRQSWDLGKWLALSKAALLVQGYATYWLSAAVAGAAVTGIYAACMSVISLANPMLLGLYNFLTPRSVLAWKHGGHAGLQSRAFKDTFLLAALMSAFCLFILFAGHMVMRLLYPSADYQGQRLVLAVLAIGTLVAAVGFPASNALASMERPRPVAAVTGAAAVLSVVFVWWFMREWGLLGAACGLLAANLVWTAGRWIAFFAFSPRSDAALPADDTLRGAR